MLRIITAATALTVLVACDSEGIDRADVSDQSTTPITLQDGETNTDTGTTDTESTDTDGSTTTDTDESTTTDADGGTTTGTDDSTTTDTDGSTTTDTGDDTTIDPDTADGSGTVIGNPDGGSSTSDGGQVINNDDDGANSDPTEEVVAPVTDGGDFTTDTGNGDGVRVSSLASDTREALCTTLSDPDDYSNIYIGDFILHNNAWRAFRAAPGHEYEQCIYTNTNGALVGWNYDWGPGIEGINGNPNASGDYYVRSYPELIYGIKDEFRTSAPQSVTGLPVRISEMPTFQIDYAYDAPQYGESRVVDASNNSRFPNGTRISGERNVAVESFFYQPDAAGQCSEGIVTRDPASNHAYEVMVWLDAGAERLPAGPNDYVADVNIRNAPYKVYTKDSDDRYVAFVAQNPQSTGTIYMNDFIDWASENAHQAIETFGANSNSVQIQDYWCMANILVGTEIFWGAGAMNITEWTITQTE